VNQPVTPVVQTGTFQAVEAKPITASQTKGSAFSGLQLTPMASNSTATGTTHTTSVMDGLTLTRAPGQLAPKGSLFNDPNMQPTGGFATQLMAQPMSQPIAQPVTQTITTPELKPTAQAAPVLITPVTTPSTAEVASASASQAASEFGLEDSEMQMLVLTEFFRSFGSKGKPKGPFVEVPTETDSPE